MQPPKLKHSLCVLADILWYAPLGSSLDFIRARRALSEISPDDVGIPVSFRSFRPDATPTTTWPLFNTKGSAPHLSSRLEAFKRPCSPNSSRDYTLSSAATDTITFESFLLVAFLLSVLASAEAVGGACSAGPPESQLSCAHRRPPAAFPLTSASAALPPAGVSVPAPPASGSSSRFPLSRSEHSGPAPFSGELPGVELGVAG